MSQAYRMAIAVHGGPDAIVREPIAVPDPGPGEVLVAHSAIGLNFIDTYHRSGLYPLPLPSGLGSEAAGRVERVGPGVAGFAAGDRVAYCGGPVGAYATHRAVAAERLVKLPPAISDELATAALLKGLTVEALVERCARVAPGQVVLVHAAAGGVGSILVQWLHAIGARVIAHAGTAEKAEAARALGAESALSCPFEDLAGAVRAETGGAGVAAVFDGVGSASLTASLDSLARRGILVSYGNASGPPPPVAPLALSKRGSLFLTRPTLFDYIATRAELDAAADRLFTLMTAGAVTARIGQRFPLDRAADAHRALEARATTGSTILIP